MAERAKEFYKKLYSSDLNNKVPQNDEDISTIEPTLHVIDITLTEVERTIHQQKETRLQVKTTLHQIS